MTREIDHIIIHCAATPPTADIGAVDIDKWHRARGWFGCGYHFVIRRNGSVESEANGDRCRPLARAGAHVGDCGPGWNKRSIGVCLVGGVSDKGKAENNFTAAQWTALEELLGSITQDTPGCKVLGHRELIAQQKAAPKDCPSFNVQAWLKEHSGSPWFGRIRPPD